MKNIQSISIWDKGIIKQATILNTYVTHLELNKSADFFYGLFTNDMELIASGNLILDNEDYQLWDADDFAWEFVAGQLSLVITGDYVAPEPIISENI